MNRLFPALTAICMGCFLAVSCNSFSSTIDDATYLGIEGYGSVTADEVKSSRFHGYRFLTAKGEKSFSILNDDDFSVQNTLEEGMAYTITLKGRRITRIESCKDSSDCPQANGKPGLRTLRNLIETAFAPVGKTLYIYGGGWDWQDEQSSRQATTIGLSSSWIRFFRQNDASFNYKFLPGTANTESDPRLSYYPFNGWNQYYYAGLDCSGYLGWVIYNVIDPQTGMDVRRGYVTASTRFAESLSVNFGYGDFSRDPICGNEDENPLKCGDIVSISGHVWMCLGTCADGSVLILHSTPSESRLGEMGGGVQLSALAKDDAGEKCEAFILADRIMKNYYPEWYSRYGAVVKSYEQYTAVTSSEHAGKFSWSLDGNILSDPDGYATMSPAQILCDLFGSI